MVRKKKSSPTKNHCWTRLSRVDSRVIEIYKIVFHGFQYPDSSDREFS